MNAGFRSVGRSPTRGTPASAPTRKQTQGAPPETACRLCLPGPSPSPAPAGSPRQGPCPASLLTSCFSGSSLRSCLSTSTSNLVVSPERIIAATSSLELQGARERAGVEWGAGEGTRRPGGDGPRPTTPLPATLGSPRMPTRLGTQKVNRLPGHTAMRPGLKNPLLIDQSTLRLPCWKQAGGSAAPSGSAAGAGA